MTCSVTKKVDSIMELLETDNIKHTFVLCSSRITPTSENQAQLVAQGGSVVHFYANRQQHTKLIGKCVLV